jgi:hypothetical protein
MAEKRTHPSAVTSTAAGRTDFSVGTTSRLLADYRTMETSASFEARSAPSSYPTHHYRTLSIRHPPSVRRSVKVVGTLTRLVTFPTFVTAWICRTQVAVAVSP